MKLEISFEQDDLTDFFENQGLQPPVELSVEDKVEWLRAYVLEPFVDALILNAVGKAKQNKAYDVARATAQVEQEQLAVKVVEVQRDKLDALPESIRPKDVKQGAAELANEGEGVARVDSLQIDS